jgi:glycosyltransferase involved in cell wall biosynthesis
VHLTQKPQAFSPITIHSTNDGTFALKIAVLEPFLVELTGHYADVTLRICNEILARGHQVIVYGNQNATAETKTKFLTAGITLVPHFRRTKKAKRKLLGKTVTRILDRQLIGKDFSRLGTADVYLWPTLETIQLVPSRHLNVNRCVIAGVWFDFPAPFNFLRLLTNLSSQSWQKTYHIGVYDKNLRESVFNRHGNLKLHNFPVPYDGAPRQFPSPSPFTIGLMGNLRKERGKAMLAELAAQIKANGWNYNFNGQLNGDVEHSNADRKADYIDDIGTQIAQCHAVFWPSDPVSYAMKTSGITYQSIANGTPIIVPAGSLPAKILEDYGLHYPHFDQQNAASVIAAGKLLFANYDEYKQQALLAAENWRKTQGTANYVSFILDLASKK